MPHPVDVGPSLRNRQQIHSGAFIPEGASMKRTLDLLDVLPDCRLHATTLRRPPREMEKGIIIPVAAEVGNSVPMMHMVEREVGHCRNSAVELRFGHWDRWRLRQHHDHLAGTRDVTVRSRRERRGADRWDSGAVGDRGLSIRAGCHRRGNHATVPGAFAGRRLCGHRILPKAARRNGCLPARPRLKLGPRP